MNTILTPSREEPASRLKPAVQSGPSFRKGDAMNDKAWVAKAAKQPMVLETDNLHLTALPPKLPNSNELQQHQAFRRFHPSYSKVKPDARFAQEMHHFGQIVGKSAGLA
jgi:hypothetical protein